MAARGEIQQECTEARINKMSKWSWAATMITAGIQPNRRNTKTSGNQPEFAYKILPTK